MLGDKLLRDTETCRIFSHLNEHEVDVDVDVAKKKAFYRVACSKDASEEPLEMMTWQLLA